MKKFSMVKWPHLNGIPIGRGGWTVAAFFITPRKMVGRQISNRNPGATRAANKWQGLLHGNYRFYWSQIWDPQRPGKEVAFIWSIWHKAVVVNEWRARIAPATIPSNVDFAPLLRASWWNINYGTTFRLGGLRGGLPSSCKNFAVLGRITWIVLTGSKRCLERRSRASMDLKLKFGNYSETSHFRPFGLNEMTIYSTNPRDTFRRLSIGFRMSSLCMLKRHEIGWLNKSRLAASPRLPCSKVLTNRGRLGTYCVKGTICILSGIGRDIVGSLL